MESVVEVPEEASGLHQPRFWIRVFLLLDSLHTHTHTHKVIDATDNPMCSSATASVGKIVVVIKYV